MPETEKKNYLSPKSFVMKKRSTYFQPGQRLSNSLLTVVESVRPDTWSAMIVRCDCGETLEISSAEAYRGRYSCGCKRRKNINSVDYSGQTVYNGAGNHKLGRTLTVLYLDELTQQWTYTCSCCAETFVLERGYNTGIMRHLKDIAGQVCKYWRREYEASDTGTGMTILYNALGRETWKLHPNKAGIRDMLVPYYKPSHVLRYPDGTVRALCGLPDFPLPDAWRRQPKQVAAQTQTANEPVDRDPDGFADASGGLVPLVPLVESTDASDS